VGGLSDARCCACCAMLCCVDVEVKRGGLRLIWLKSMRDAGAVAWSVWVPVLQALFGFDRASSPPFNDSTSPVLHFSYNSLTNITFWRYSTVMHTRSADTRSQVIENWAHALWRAVQLDKGTQKWPCLGANVHANVHSRAPECLAAASCPTSAPAVAITSAWGPTAAAAAPSARHWASLISPQVALFSLVQHLIWDPKILYRVAAHIRFRHSPEPITVLQWGGVA